MFCKMSKLTSVEFLGFHLFALFCFDFYCPILFLNLVYCTCYAGCSRCLVFEVLNYLKNIFMRNYKGKLSKKRLRFVQSKLIYIKRKLVLGSNKKCS